MAAPPSRRSIINRLLRLLNHMIMKLEKDVKDPNVKAGAAETEVLGRMVTALGKLMELETAESRMVPGSQNRELLDIRDKLVQRIDELKRN
jgi:hypothetical protein